MSIWHRTILLTVGAVAVAAEEVQKIVKRAADEVQARIDREMELGEEPKLVRGPTKA